MPKKVSIGIGFLRAETFEKGEEEHDFMLKNDLVSKEPEFRITQTFSIELDRKQPPCTEFQEGELMYMGGEFLLDAQPLKVGAEGLLASELDSEIPSSILTAFARLILESPYRDAGVGWSVLQGSRQIELEVSCVGKVKEWKTFFKRVQEEFAQWMHQPLPLP